jgi:hypothetical protein
MRRWTPLLLAAGLMAAIPAAASPVTVGGQYRYWSFSDANDLRDALAYWAHGPVHVQLEVWDFVDPVTPDQLRPEVGLHLRDRRRSVYTLQWRHERGLERYWLGTDQVLSRHVVGRAELSPIIDRYATLWVGSLGADYYWGSWNFLAATVIRDPRSAGLWVVPVRARLANAANDWVQVTVAPASQRSLGWAVDVKRHWIRLGVERNDRYDFTRLDNTIVTAGFELRLNRKE